MATPSTRKCLRVSAATNASPTPGKYRRCSFMITLSGMIEEVGASATRNQTRPRLVTGRVLRSRQASTSITQTMAAPSSTPASNGVSETRT